MKRWGLIKQELNVSVCQVILLTIPEYSEAIENWKVVVVIYVAVCTGLKCLAQVQTCYVYLQIVEAVKQRVVSVMWTLIMMKMKMMSSRQSVAAAAAAALAYIYFDLIVCCCCSHV